jgi:hypothetical protein
MTPRRVGGVKTTARANRRHEALPTTGAWPTTSRAAPLTNAATVEAILGESFIKPPNWLAMLPRGTIAAEPEAEAESLQIVVSGNIQVIDL